MICRVRDDGWCERHKTVHVGRLLQLALMDDRAGDGMGEDSRLLWDRRLAAGLYSPGQYEGGLPRDRSLRCVRRGEDPLEERTCPDCGGNVRVKVFPCDLHRECTLAKSLDGVSCCLSCKDHSAVRRTVLVNRQSPGDCLVMTAAIESLHLRYPGKYLTAVRSPCPDVFRHNPNVAHITGEGWEETEMHCHLEPGINQSNQRPVHFMEAYCRHLGASLGIPLDLMVNRPVLRFSEEEKAQAPLVEGRYWIICSGIKQDYTAKGWIQSYWQEVVDQLAGQVTFVQVGESHHIHKPLRGVVNLIGKTDCRGLINLCRTAEGGIGGITFIQHIFAALGKSYVCIAGGREPPSWTHYNTQTTLHTVGSLDCCRSGGCWKSRVVPLGDGDPKDKELCRQTVSTGDGMVQRCMVMIKPVDVVRAVERILDGDRL